MKKLFFILLLAFTVASCAKDEIGFNVDPNAMISLKPAAGTKLRSAEIDSIHLSALEIVKQTTIIQYNYFLWGEAAVWERVFESNQRDTTSNTPCLKMYGLDIINQEGNYVPDFIESTDCILIKFDLHAPSGAPRDTIAYIPNATLRTAETIIKQSYADKNEALVLNTFNEAFTFIPITGAEYKALKSENLQ